MPLMWTRVRGETEPLVPSVLLAILGSGLLCAALMVGRNVVGGTDFLAFYSGARLVGTGHMYDPEAIWNVQLHAIGKYGPALLYIRLPCFALLLWPLAQLPFTIAKLTWIAFQLLTVIAAVWLWPGSRRVATIVACWSFPVLVCLADGTDTTIIFLWLVMWRRLEIHNHPLWAGVALAFCVAKFHLFLFIPLLLLRHRRWLVIQGAAIGLSVLLGLSFLAGGWRWPMDYLHVLAKPSINPNTAVMPNIHGLVHGFAPTLEVPLIVATVVLTCWAIFKLDYDDALAITLGGGLLCSFHAYVMDGVLLLPAIILMLERYRSRWPGFIAGVLAAPVPWVAVLLRGL